MKNNIEIKNLKVDFKTKNGKVKTLRGLDLVIEEAVITGIIGESGSGKSVMANSILNLLPDYAISQGEIIYKDINLLKDQKNIKNFYGKEFGLIPQYPGESLNPSMTILKQFKSTNRKMPMKDVKISAKKLLEYMGFENSEKILKLYPHELSGGMQQRVLCALTISTSPKWIIADEPTKGLDEDVKNVVLENLRKVKTYNNSSMLIISHDIEVAKDLCNQLAIMYAGNVVEIGENVIENPLHPYTKAFINSLPNRGFHVMEGIAPGPYEEIKGCSFYSRCKDRKEICSRKNPKLYEKDSRKVRCFLYA